MLIITDTHIFVKDGDGVEYIDNYSDDYLEKYPNIVKDLCDPYKNIKEKFSDISSDQAEIVFSKGKIRIKAIKEKETNIIDIEKKNNTFITTNQQFIYADSNLNNLMKVLLKGYTIV